MKSDADEREAGVDLKTATWVCTTYFAEGYPYAIVNTVAEAMFTELKASLQVIGLTSLFHLPWNLKFLWAPAIDTYETKRWWTLGVELLLVGLLLVLAFASATTGSLWWMAIVFVALAFVAATHDIAIDGFYLEVLGERDQSRYVGYRVAAYRVALTVGAGLLVSLGGAVGWTAAWLLGAAVMAALWLVHLLVLPREEIRRLPLRRAVVGMARTRIWWIAVLALVVTLELRFPVVRPAIETFSAYPIVAAVGSGGWITLGLLGALLVGLAAVRLRRRIRGSDEGGSGKAFVEFLAQPKIGRILAFVATFRLGESFLLKMRYPFLRSEIGLSPSYIGSVIVGAGGVASIAATLVGGHLIAKHGLRRWLWPFVLAQNVLNLLYMGVAMVPDPTSLNVFAVTSLIALEHIGAGLGTSVFMVYLMRCCDPRHRATHMAILTALMSVGFTLAGVASGFIASALGFELYFAFTFVATIPSMLLLPFLPYLDARAQEGTTA